MDKNIKEERGKGKKSQILSPRLSKHCFLKEYVGIWPTNIDSQKPLQEGP